MKNLQGTNSGGDESEDQISDLKHKKEKSIQSEQQGERRIQKNEDKFRNLWDNFKRTYQHPNHWGARRKRGRARN